MGASGSKAKNLVDVAKSTAQVVQGTAEAATTAARRRIAREGQQYMGTERAQKELDAQKIVPRRAPLNLGSAESKLTENMRDERLEEIEKHQQKDKDFVHLMKDVFISSTDPEDFTKQPIERHSGKRSEDLEDKLPRRSELAPSTYSAHNVPRGRSDMSQLIKGLYNHKMNPQDWGPVEIAKKLNLRESDTKDILENFELLEGTSIFKSQQPTQKN